MSIRIGNREFNWGERTYLMGIVNVTPDSFSGDGLASNVASAVEQAKRFEAEGADIIDVGGESTRPDAPPVTEEEEMRRVVPAIEAIAARVGIPVSVDTYKAGVARSALDSGAVMLNDIWGLKKEPALAVLAAERNLPIVLMSNQRGEKHRHIVPAVLADLRRAVDLAERAGVSRERIIVDPGVGFGKTVEQNLELIRRLRELKALGCPVLLGTSRKSMIGIVLGRPAEDRLEGTAATVAIGIANGADIVRVHDVSFMARVSKMADAVAGRKWR